MIGLTLNRVAPPHGRPAWAPPSAQHPEFRSTALVDARGRVSAFDDDQLRQAAAQGRAALDALDRATAAGVIKRARSVTGLLDPPEARVLIAAAYLHDIGHASELRDTGFHPLDGARFLRRHGHERPASLLARRTGARVEAEELGLGCELAESPEEPSLVAKLLTCCDLTTSPGGEPLAAALRLDGIIERYGGAAPARAARRSRPTLLAQVAEVEQLLAGDWRPAIGRPDLQSAMFTMRTLPSAAAGLELTDVEQQVLAYVAEGLSPKEIAARVEMPEDELYRLVAWVLDELEPAPNGNTMRDVYARPGGRPAASAEVEEFERRYGASLPADGDG